MLYEDVVKEALHGRLATIDSAALSHASAEVIWRLLPSFPVGAIVDLWLDPVRDAGAAADGLRRAETTARAVEIQCRCPGEVAVERYRGRLRSATHRPPDAETLARIQEAADTLGPTGVGPHLTVDSTMPSAIADITAWIRDQPAET